MALTFTPNNNPAKRAASSYGVIHRQQDQKTSQGAADPSRFHPQMIQKRAALVMAGRATIASHRGPQLTETRPPRDLARVVVPHGLTTVHTLRHLTLPQLGLLLHLRLQGLQHPRPIFLFHFSLQLHESRRPRSQQWWPRRCGGWPRLPCSR